MLFPMMEAGELKELAEDIKANGQIESILIYEGQVLDGRNRLAACGQAGVEPRLQQLDGEIASPVLYVLSKNLRRRHLTVGQRARIAVAILPMLNEERKERPFPSKNLQSNHADMGASPVGDEVDYPRTVEIAARATEVGGRTISKALARPARIWEP